MTVSFIWLVLQNKKCMRSIIHIDSNSHSHVYLHFPWQTVTSSAWQLTAYLCDAVPLCFKMSVCKKPFKLKWFQYFLQIKFISIWIISPLVLKWWQTTDKILCAVLLEKSGWRSGHQSRLPPLLQMLYVDWVSVYLNLTSRVSSRYSGFLPPENWLLLYSNLIGCRTSLKTTFGWVELPG